jgi:hypothetical protein
VPPDDQIECYTKDSFEGDGYQMKIGFYDYPNVGGVGNNQLKSLKIGKNVSVILYENAYRKGRVLVYHGPKRIPHLPPLWTNAVSGIEVVKKLTIQCQLYDAPFYQGGTVMLTIGFYDYPTVGGIGSAKLNSMIIPQGLSIKLFSRPNREGETIEFLGPQKLSFLPSGWNKKVLGVEIKSVDRNF